MRFIGLDTYYNDPAQDDFAKAMDIVEGDPDKQLRFGYPDDWDSEIVAEILDDARREAARKGESDVYALARELLDAG